MRRNRGLTLAEVMVTMGILAVALLAILAAFTGALELSARSNEITMATELARQVLEVTLDEGYDFVPDGTKEYDGRNGDSPTAGGFPPAPYPSATVGETSYQVKVSVTPKGATLKVVTVEVYWAERSRVVLETFVYPL